MAIEETYIGDLPTIIEITPADSLIVETTDGTKRILWQNIIVGEDNVDFYNILTQNQTDILTLSSSYVLPLSTQVQDLTTQVASVTANDESREKYGYVNCIIDSNGSLAVNSSSSNVASVTLDDGGSRVKVELTPSLNVDVENAVINVTFSQPISGNDDDTFFRMYLPVIDGRNNTDSYFKIGAAQSQFPTNNYTITLSSDTVNWDGTLTIPNTNFGSTLPIYGQALDDFGINISFRYV